MRASSTDEWIEWSPGFAPHVKGKYTRRTFDDDGLPEEQHIRVHCTHCGDTWDRECLSGQVRGHIARFATAHLHRDPLAAQRIVRPGSLRKDKEP